MDRFEPDLDLTVPTRIAPVTIYNPIRPQPRHTPLPGLEFFCSVLPACFLPAIRPLSAKYQIHSQSSTSPPQNVVKRVNSWHEVPNPSPILYFAFSKRSKTGEIPARSTKSGPNSVLRVVLFIRLFVCIYGFASTGYKTWQGIV